MLEAIIAIAAVVLDRLSKMWAVGSLSHMPGQHMDVLPGVFEFRYVQNEGMAFSLLEGKTWLFIVITVLIVACLLGYLVKYRAVESVWTRIAIASIIGGALGNLIDRLLYGYVIDFINPTFMRFAVFNVADIFVTCGAILFIFALLILPQFYRKKERAHE